MRLDAVRHKVNAPGVSARNLLDFLPAILGGGLGAPWAFPAHPSPGEKSPGARLRSKRVGGRPCHVEASVAAPRRGTAKRLRFTAANAKRALSPLLVGARASVVVATVVLVVMTMLMTFMVVVMSPVRVRMLLAARLL
jgi:hypothetical protein